jgi:isocitrate dehydrogenase (NAD+)
VTLIPGDGIGPEVSEAARRVLEASGVAFRWQVEDIGGPALAREGTPLPARVVDSIRSCGVALKGPVATQVGQGYRSVNLALREALGLYVGIRPCRSLIGAPAPLPSVDVVVVRMTTGDVYAGLEYEPESPPTARLRALVAESHGVRLPADTGITLKAISLAEGLRVAHAAFTYAREHGRRGVTAVHKANVMHSSDGVFLSAARAAAEEHPDVEYEERLVDAVCHDLVARPETCDVLLTTMLYGDVLSDLCAGLVGGLGVVPGATFGDSCALFEPVHGTAPRHAGRNRANPIAMILSGAMLLRHVGEGGAAARVEAAVGEVVRDGTTLTYDLLRPREPDAGATTTAVADAHNQAL